MVQTNNQSLRFIANGGVDFFTQKNSLFFPPELQFEPNDGELGTALLSNSDNTNLNLNGNFVHVYTPRGGGTVATTSAGVQFARRDQDISRIVGKNLVGGQQNVDAATDRQISEQRQRIKNLGYFLQEEFLTVGQKLLLTAGIRADQSSLNADAGKLYWFPKAAASYRFANATGFLTELKLRAAYGESGNEPTYGQIFTPLTATTNIGGLPGLVVQEPLARRTFGRNGSERSRVDSTPCWGTAPRVWKSRRIRRVSVTCWLRASCRPHRGSSRNSSTARSSAHVALRWALLSSRSSERTSPGWSGRRSPPTGARSPSLTCRHS